MKTNTAYSNAVIVSRLSIERCQNYLAHMHALLYLCEPSNMGLDKTVSGSMLKLMENMERELNQSVAALGTYS